MAKKTKQMILSAFESILQEKDFDKITVVEIVERCGVNRNTFYYHFQDVYALLEAWIAQNREMYGNLFEEQMSLQEAFFRVIRFVQDHKAVIMHIYKSTSHTTLLRHFENETYRQTLLYIRRHAEGVTVDFEDVRAMAIFYTSAMAGMLYRWISDEMKYDPVPFVRRICRIVDGNIEQLLRKLAIEASETNDETCVSK